MSDSPAASGSLFDAILGAADRDAAPGVRPVVSFRPDDDPAFLAEVERRARARLRLLRRGVDHGHVAELHPAGLVPPMPHRRKLEAIWTSRWMAAQPVLVPGLLDLAGLGAALEEALRRRAALLERGGLRQWLTAALQGRFQVGNELEHTDERDVERLAVSIAQAPEAGLWIKASRLSTYPRDASLRVRFSFGAEGDDDASHDEARHDRVAELARAALPEARAIEGCTRLGALLQRFCGRPVRTTQHIAYWNAPNGGAQFHHDAFGEDAASAFMARQLGVAFVQLSGRTLWLALSIEDLAGRVAEFVELMAEGELDWVRAELFAAEADWRDLQALVADGEGRARLVHELGLPHCGRLQALVNRGPEFTALLADCGHALLLRPGDVLLLPNHGLERTAMHSVFCADTRPTYGLSLALRAGTGS